MSLEAELDAVLTEMKRCWGALDFRALKKLWDPDDKQPFYMPEESLEPLCDWAMIDDYWAKSKKSIKKIIVRTWDLKVKLVHPDIAIAIYQMHWSADVVGYPKPIGGSNRVCAGFRKRPEGWRFFQLIEAPWAPNLYIKKKMYELDVDKELLEGK